MGNTLAYLQHHSSGKYYNQERHCCVCNKIIDPDITPETQWCDGECDRIWCNDCWKTDVKSMLLHRFGSCGDCMHYSYSDELYKKVLFYLVERDNINVSELMKEFAENTNIKKEMEIESEKDDAKLDAMIF